MSYLYVRYIRNKQILNIIAQHLWLKYCSHSTFEWTQFCCCACILKHKKKLSDNNNTNNNTAF